MYVCVPHTKFLLISWYCKNLIFSWISFYPAYFSVNACKILSDLCVVPALWKIWMNCQALTLVVLVTSSEALISSWTKRKLGNCGIKMGPMCGLSVFAYTSWVGSHFDISNYLNCCHYSGTGFCNSSSILPYPKAMKFVSSFCTIF